MVHSFNQCHSIVFRSIQFQTSTQWELLNVLLSAREPEFAQGLASVHGRMKDTIGSRTHGGGGSGSGSGCGFVCLLSFGRFANQWFCCGTFFGFCCCCPGSSTVVSGVVVFFL